MDIIENKHISKLVIFIPIIITLKSIIKNVFYDFSMIILIADISLLIVLIGIYIDFKKNTKNKRPKIFRFIIFPIIYFPIEFIFTGGIQGSGLLYFFLFAIVIIYFNPNKIGLFAVLILYLQICIIIYCQKFNIYFCLIENTDFNLWNPYLYHFPVVALGYTFIIYEFIKKEKQLSNRLYEFSNKDYLTNIFNRRYLIDYMNGLKKKNNILIEDLYLVFFDIDKLKTINDLYGHEVGDEIIKLFTKTVQDITDNNIFVRFAGDEFILILNDINLKNSNKLIEEIKKSFIKKSAEKFHITTTVSAGMENCNGKTIDEVIRHADHKMYHEKNSKILNDNF